MFTQTVRASKRSQIARVARQQMISKRTFIVPTAVRRADLVQDLYLRELKSYKAPQIKASDSEGHVLKFSPPKAPTSPEETDIAKELAAYEASTVEVEGQAEGGAEAKEVDWFEEEVEEEAAHH